MKLEMVKFKISEYLKGVIIANLIILGILFIIIFGSKADMEIPFSNYEDAVLIIGTMVKATFSIFAAVLIFAFTSMVISSLFLNFSLFILNIFANFIEVPLTQNILVKSLINIVVYSAAFSFVSLIPVYVGMRKKSGSATIVTSIILVSLLNSGNGENSLGTIIIIPLVLAIIGAVAAYLSIKDVEKVDVVNV